MDNRERVAKFLGGISPRSATNSEIASHTGIKPHQQVFQLTRKLMTAGEITGRRRGKDWDFWVEDLGRRSGVSSNDSSPSPAERTATSRTMTARDFEVFAREIFTKEFGIMLAERELPCIRKRFDMVSQDLSVVGDAKYFSLVNGERYPPAKMSVIAEHVWLLEKSVADKKFLVFGNERRVPEIWLSKYGTLVDGVLFYFLSAEGELSRLN